MHILLGHFHTTGIKAVIKGLKYASLQLRLILLGSWCFLLERPVEDNHVTHCTCKLVLTGITVYAVHCNKRQIVHHWMDMSLFDIHHVVVWWCQLTRVASCAALLLINMKPGRIFWLLQASLLDVESHDAYMWAWMCSVPIWAHSESLRLQIYYLRQQDSLLFDSVVVRDTFDTKTAWEHQRTDVSSYWLSLMSLWTKQSQSSCTWVCESV